MAGDNSTPLRILSLDGGGVRGLTSLLLLQSIFQSIENQTGRPSHPHEYFDLIAGTSTGGLIAIMLGRLRMSIGESIEAYKILSPQIFKKKWWSDLSLLKALGSEMNRTWFQGRNLQDAVCSLLSNRGLDPEIRLMESEDPKCKVFVCAVDAHSSTVKLLRTYKTKAPGQVNYDCSVWEAARATTAAPLFFEPITFQNGDFTFVDGAVRANNPVDEVLNEARSLWPGREIACLLSLGTGISIQRGFHPKKNRLHAVLASLAKIATDANAKHIAFKNGDQGLQLTRQQRYFRFSVARGLSGIEISDFEKLPFMQAATIQYTTEVSREIEECAQRLVLDSTTAVGHGTAHTTIPENIYFSWRDIDLTKPGRWHVTQLPIGAAIIVEIALLLSAYNQVRDMTKTPTGRPRDTVLLRERLATQNLIFQAQCFRLLSLATLQDDATALHNFVFSSERDCSQLLPGLQCTDEQLGSLAFIIPSTDVIRILNPYEDDMARLRRNEFLLHGDPTIVHSLVSSIGGLNLALSTLVQAKNKLSTPGIPILPTDDLTESKISHVRKANLASQELQAACRGLWSCTEHPSHSASIKLSTRSGLRAKCVLSDDRVSFDLILTDSDPKSCGEPICLEVDCVRDIEDNVEILKERPMSSACHHDNNVPHENDATIWLSGPEGEGSTPQRERMVAFADEAGSSRPPLKYETKSGDSEVTGHLCLFAVSGLDPNGAITPGGLLKAVNPTNFSFQFRRLCRSGMRLETLHSLPYPWNVHHSGSLRFANKVEKMKLAAALADMVLTYHSTPWLEEGFFSKHNVSFWNPTSSNHHSLGTPFLCYHLDSESGRANATKKKQQDFDPRAKNMTLFGLGIMLLELEFEMPIESLVERAEVSAVARPVDGFFAVKQLAGNEMGTVYGRIVRICLDCDFGLGLREYSMQDVMLQRRYYVQVISEFEKLLPRWQKIYGSEMLE